MRALGDDSEPGIIQPLLTLGDLDHFADFGIFDGDAGYVPVRQGDGFSVYREMVVGESWMIQFEARRPTAAVTASALTALPPLAELVEFEMYDCGTLGHFRVPQLGRGN